MSRLGRGARPQPLIRSRALEIPTNTVPPALATTGPTNSPEIAYPGDVLSMTTGTWTGGPGAYRYEWRWSDVPQAIPGATSPTHTIDSNDIGHNITGRVWASNLNGESASFAVAQYANLDASTHILAPRSAAVSGGGGITTSGRKGGAAGTSSSSGGAQALAGRKGARVNSTVSGGGSVQAVSSGNGQAAVVATAGGNVQTAGSKQARSAAQASGGGNVVASGAQTPQTGGVLATALFGGGGRLGRSHPAVGLLPHGQVAMAAANPDARSGSVAGTGGGGITIRGAKGSIATTQRLGFLPPFIDVVTGVVMSGGGTQRTTYVRSQSGVGITTATAGGAIKTRAAKGARGTVTVTGGGTPVLGTSKGARGTTSATGGGQITTAFVVGESRSYALAMSGGGGITTRGAKTAFVTAPMSGGGTVTLRVARASRVTVAVTGGGTVSTTGTQGGPNVPGQVSVSGGGRLATVTRKAAAQPLQVSGGGSISVTGGRNVTGTVTVSGGGQIHTTRLSVAFAPAPRPRITRARRGRVRLTGVSN